MAVGKQASKPKGQKAITTFFRKPKKSNDEDDDVVADDVDDENADENEGADADDADIAKGSGIESSDLPPIHEIPAIFADLVSRVPQMKDVVKHLSGRKMRVATMCSGTESPLLALELIRRSILEQHDLSFEFEHVFSCEIEPFKQAYIERNFQPPLLFRDVCELGDVEATTAYGSLAPVPGDVDILIAGTSCVDYSNLNNSKQDIDAQGESGATFRGMMSWVKTHRPPLVILENVCGAPWDRVVDYFEKNGYAAEYFRVDTKTFYIPHTRTRVYLLAVNKRGSHIPNKWRDLVKQLQRPASSTLDAFLLPTDDPRIHQARQKLAHEEVAQRGRIDWNRCESRHQRARLEEELGTKRPLTSWEEGGSCKMPDGAWPDWARSQVERVWDLMDISLLRSAKKGVDPMFKTQVWNLSQNVDRSTGASKPGICPCLTPSMIPFITNRGGPMVGLEALSMQGLPVDELLLTRETEDQLADLAGNAMSTTVVGACMLAALVVGQKLLKAGDDRLTYEQRHNDDTDQMEVDEDGAQASKKDEVTAVPLEEHISGEEKLLERPLDLSASTTQLSLADILKEAHQSARLCTCEGRKDITDRTLNRCQDCGWTSCVKCGGRPEHTYASIDLQANPRLSPSKFEKDLKALLPMSLTLSNITPEVLTQLAGANDIDANGSRWKDWSAAVLRSTEKELRFVEPKRQEVWSVIYQSPTAMLELQLHPKQPEWRLFAKAEAHEPANAEIRKVLELPVGRFVCTTGLFSGRWEFALPVVRSAQLVIEGSEPVPAWEAKLGLMGDEFKNKTVHSRLEITVPEEQRSLFDRDISGVYSLLDKCGTSNSALHKREPTEADGDKPPIFMLLDPSRCGASSQDYFVFSTSTRRYEYGENRPIIAHLEPRWRQSDQEGTQNVRCIAPCKWVEASHVKLTPAAGLNAAFASPAGGISFDVSQSACGSATALLVCRVPLHNQAGDEWPRGEWQELDKVHERVTFKSLAWLLERIRNIDGKFNEWQSADGLEHDIHCSRCAPSSPSIKWSKVKTRMLAIEDTIQAGEFERSLKRRPAPFVTQLKLDESGVGIVRIGVNIASLMHRALSRLPTEGRSEQATLSWCLDTDFVPAVKMTFPKFKLSSNRHDVEHAQPPHFKLKLRPEQLRSLTWMLAQEAADVPPFIEEEISEAILEPLGWRAEGRAQRAVHIRGGVLADEVGYGKTAITLGLIDCAAKDVKKEFAAREDMKGRIAVKATCIIVPPHLTRQWESEVKKFAGTHFKVQVIHTATNLNSLTIEDVMDADMIIMASNLMKGTGYIQNLEALAGAGDLPLQDGRFFDARYKSILTALEKQVERLREEGPEAVMAQIKAGRTTENEDVFVPTKRLKGKSFRDAATKKEAAAAAPKKKGPKIPPHRAEVVIPVPRRRASSPSEAASVASSPPPTPAPSSPAPSSEAEALAEDSDAPRPRRAAKRKAIVISDSEDEVPKKKTKQPAKKSAKRPAKRSKASEESDYEESGGEESESDVDEEDEEEAESDFEESSEDERPAKAKRGAKGKKPAAKKAPAKKRSAATSEEETTDAMDVDEEDEDEDEKPAKGKGKGKAPAKKKSDAEKKPKKRREETDPWKLTSSQVKKNWQAMRSPALEMFHFARVVVDEYTYLAGKTLTMVAGLAAERQWVLSGTPPIHDFGALKTISAFLNLHLGIDDDNEGQSLQVKKRKREQTAVEKFHSFREVHSLEWHQHRHELGQRFLDIFVRQNIAEIDEISCGQEIKKIVLPAAERAIYLELEHYLRALDMTVKRAKKTESDRDKRLAEALGESNSAEEALLKRCSHFELENDTKENAMKACEFIVQERTKQLESCKKSLLKHFKEALKMEKAIGKLPDESLFREYVRITFSEGVGDEDASAAAVALLEEVGISAPLKSLTNKQLDGRSGAKGKGKSKDEPELPKKIKDLIWEHREQTHEIRRTTKELVARVRSLRYFTVVRDLQKQAEKPPPMDCPGCGRKDLSVEEIAVLSSCGHTGCYDCVMACAEKEECVYAAKGSCRAAARVLNVVKGDTLGVDDEARDGRGKHYGLKLEKIIDLILNQIPAKERVLIFVQFPDLTAKVGQALKAHGIKFLEIKGTASQKSKNLELFQQDSKERVLLLNVMDESASGANLTSANHAIFLSPLLAPSREIYDACETQAVGRLRRYGQLKHVNIWRFLSLNTIDVEIFEQRTGTRVQ